MSNDQGKLRVAQRSMKKAQRSMNNDHSKPRAASLLAAMAGLSEPPPEFERAVAGSRGSGPPDLARNAKRARARKASKAARAARRRNRK